MGIEEIMNKMDMECGLEYKEILMKVGLWMGNLKDKELISGKTDKNMKVIEEMAKWMDKEDGLGLKKNFMKVSMWMEKDKGLEFNWR